MQLHASRRPTRLSVCRQCLQTWLPSRTALSTLSDPRARGRPRPTNTAASLLYAPLRSPHLRHASTQPPEDATPPQSNSYHPTPGKPIREYLREIQSQDSSIVIRPIPRDAARAGNTTNSMTRVESHDLAEIDHQSVLVDGGEEVDLDKVKLWHSDSADDTTAPESLFARPYGTVSPKAGDLIEVSTDSWRVQLLAVCLGKFRGVDHYYTNTGKWFASTNVRTMFHVTNFATPEEMASTIAALPKEATEPEASEEGQPGDRKQDESTLDEIGKMFNILNDMKKGPTREAGAGLLKKLQEFAHQSTSVHMAYATLLDNAYSIVRKAIFPPPPAKYVHAVDPFPVRWIEPFTKEESLKLYKQAYFSLDDIASILFRHQQNPFSGNRSSQLGHRKVHALRNYVDETNNKVVGNDEFTAPAMYAIYRALVSNDVAFRPVSARLGNPNEIHDDALANEETHSSPLSRSRSCLFSVSRPEDVDMITEVEALVREFNNETDDIPDNGQVRDLGDTRHRLAAFVMNAREAIDESRKTRTWTPYGMLLSIPPKENPVLEQRASPDARERRLAFVNAVRTEGLNQRVEEIPPGPKYFMGPPELLNAYRKKEWRTHRAPAKKEPPKPAIKPEVREWYPYDIMVLHFMHLWAGHQRFSAASKLHWIGSSILRATQRYESCEYLSMSTGWTFLQEVGYLKPWDVPARYSMSLPGLPPKRDGTLDRTAHLTETFEPPAADSYKAHDPEDLLSEDIFAGKRKSWSHLNTYCIDSADTDDIDDGISIEGYRKSHHFWVHVHVADPASRIRPGSKLAEMAQQISQSSYLPGHNEPMFPEKIVRDRFSLKKGSPCLTFSSYVNMKGEVLKTEIKPGILGEVIYMTPEQASSVVTQQEKDTVLAGYVPKVAQPRYAELPWTTAAFAVGTPNSLREEKKRSGPRRVLTSAPDLDRRVSIDLKTLMRAASMLRARRLRKGAMPLYWPRPQVKVQMNYTDVVKSQSLVPSEGHLGHGTLPDSIATWKGGRSTTFFRCQGDPYIKIFYDGYEDHRIMAFKNELQGKDSSRVSGAANRMVESLMRLAGEVAADWCAERNIAVPFRGQPAALPHLERLEKLAREDIYPPLVNGDRPPEDKLKEFRLLLGSDEITAVPVPHVTMGVKRYVKATSPLRRFSDLVVHWQIESALRAEMNTPGSRLAKLLLEDAPAPPDPGRGVVRAGQWNYWGRDADSMRAAEEKIRKERERDNAITGPYFTREDLERDILPLLRVRERTLRQLDNGVGRDQWMLQALVRAWKGGEYVELVERPVFGVDRKSMRRARKTMNQEEKRIRRQLKIRTKKISTPYVPPPLKKVAFRNMRFTVTSVNARQGFITGRLDWFERVALMEVAGLNPEEAEETEEEKEEKEKKIKQGDAAGDAAADETKASTEAEEEDDEDEDEEDEDDEDDEDDDDEDDDEDDDNNDKRRDGKYGDDNFHATPDTKGMTRLRLNDIQPGQVYPVALDFVDIHANRVIVRRTGDLCVPPPPPPPPTDRKERKKLRKIQERAVVWKARKVYREKVHGQKVREADRMESFE